MNCGHLFADRCASMIILSQFVEQYHEGSVDYHFLKVWYLSFKHQILWTLVFIYGHLSAITIICLLINLEEFYHA